MESNLVAVMEAIATKLPAKAPKLSTKPKPHRCMLFVRTQGSSGLYAKAFTCLECGHKTHSLEDLPVFRSNYAFGEDVSLEPYWAFMELQLQEAKLKAKKDKRQGVRCLICEFAQSPGRKVNYL